MDRFRSARNDNDAQHFKEDFTLQDSEDVYRMFETCARRPDRLSKNVSDLLSNSDLKKSEQKSKEPNEIRVEEIIKLHDSSPVANEVADPTTRNVWDKLNLTSNGLLSPTVFNSPSDVITVSSEGESNPSLLRSTTIGTDKIAIAGGRELYSQSKISQSKGKTSTHGPKKFTKVTSHGGSDCFSSETSDGVIVKETIFDSEVHSYETIQPRKKAYETMIDCVELEEQDGTSKTKGSKDNAKSSTYVKGNDHFTESDKNVGNLTIRDYEGSPRRYVPRRNESPRSRLNDESQNVDGKALASPYKISPSARDRKTSSTRPPGFPKRVNASSPVTASVLPGEANNGSTSLNETMPSLSASSKSSSSTLSRQGCENTDDSPSKSQESGDLSLAKVESRNAKKTSDENKLSEELYAIHIPDNYNQKPPPKRSSLPVEKNIDVEFSETKKVLDEFFKPISSASLVSDDGDVTSDDVRYKLTKRTCYVDVTDDPKSERDLSTKLSVQEIHDKRISSHRSDSQLMSDQLQEIRNVDVLNGKSGSGAGDTGYFTLNSPEASRVAHAGSQGSHNAQNQSAYNNIMSLVQGRDKALLPNDRDPVSRNFTLSPETTDCDSFELESELSINEGSFQSSGTQARAAMPVLEDGLSSGHVSEEEDDVVYSSSGSVILRKSVQSNTNNFHGEKSWLDDLVPPPETSYQFAKSDGNESLNHSENVWNEGNKTYIEDDPSIVAALNDIKMAMEAKHTKMEQPCVNTRILPGRNEPQSAKISSDKSTKIKNCDDPWEINAPSPPPLPSRQPHRISDKVSKIPDLEDDESFSNDDDDDDDDDVDDDDDDDIYEERVPTPKNMREEQDLDTDQETDRLLSQQYDDTGYFDKKNDLEKKMAANPKPKEVTDPKVLIEGVLFRSRYLGSTQLVCEGQPTKATRMIQAEEAVSRIKAPNGEKQPSTEVDLFISTEKIMVLNTDLKEIMMDHSLRSISYIADIGELLVIMARRRMMSPANSGDAKGAADVVFGSAPKMICHVFESEEAQFIAQSIGQAFQVAYIEFLKANGIEDSSFVKEMDYQEVLNSQEIFGDELALFAKKERQKEVVVPKAKGEILGVVIVESGWGSMLPTIVLANMSPNGPAARCGQLNIGDQIIAINGISLVGLPLSTCQNYIKNCKNKTAVKLTAVSCPPVVEVKIKRPDTKYQLGFSVQNGVICSLLRGGIAERGGVRVGHRIIEINGQSVVAIPHERIVNLLATSVGEISMKTMPTSMFRLLTGQETPLYI